MFSHRSPFQILRVTFAATVALLLGCAPVITPRPPAVDPTSAQSSEAPPRPAPPLTTADPLLTVAAEPLQDPPKDPQPAPKQDAPPQMQHDKDGHHGHHGHHMHGADKPAPSPVFTCPMHPDVRSDKAGRCDKCGMKLMPEKDKSDDKGDAP